MSLVIITFLPGVLLRGDAGEVGGDDKSPNLLRRAFTEGDFESSLALEEPIDSGDFTLGGVLGRVFLMGTPDVVSFDPAFEATPTPLVVVEDSSITTHELVLVTVSLCPLRSSKAFNVSSKKPSLTRLPISPKGLKECDLDFCPSLSASRLGVDSLDESGVEPVRARLKSAFFFKWPIGGLGKALLGDLLTFEGFGGGEGLSPMVTVFAKPGFFGGGRGRFFLSLSLSFPRSPSFFAR